MATEEFPDHLSPREAAAIEQGLAILVREPAFRTIINLFASRKAQSQAIEPLKKALLDETWKLTRKSALLP